VFDITLGRKELSESRFPQEITLGTDVDQENVTGDGWCMYNSYLRALGLNTTGIETDGAKQQNNLRNWRLACTISQLALRKYRQDPDYKSYLTQVLESVPIVYPAGYTGAKPESGYQIERDAPDGTPYVVFRTPVGDEVHRQYVVGVEEYLKAIAELRIPGDISSGPAIWADAIPLLSIFAEFQESIGIIIYNKKEAGNLQLLGDSTLEYFAPKDFDDKGSIIPPKYTVILIYSGNNHYDALLPKSAALRELTGYDPEKGYPTATLISDDTFLCNINPDNTVTVKPPQFPGRPNGGEEEETKNDEGNTNIQSINGTKSTDPNIENVEGEEGEKKTEEPTKKPEELPAWVPHAYFAKSNVKAECLPHALIQTPDCVERTMMDDILAAQEFAQEGRLVKDPDGMLDQYHANLDALKKETDADKKATLQQKMDKKYANRDVLIEGEDGVVKSFKVVNPYRALAFREETGVSFADPAGSGKTPEQREILRQNAEVLKAIAPAEIINDNPYAIALLEALWFCGTSHSMSENPRCFPARVLAELREYNEAKKQDRGALAAKVFLEDKSWPTVKLMIDFLKKGTPTYAAAPITTRRKVLFQQKLQETRKAEEETRKKAAEEKAAKEQAEKEAKQKAKEVEEAAKKAAGTIPPVPTPTPTPAPSIPVPTTTTAPVIQPILPIPGRGLTILPPPRRIAAPDAYTPIRPSVTQLGSGRAQIPFILPTPSLGGMPTIRLGRAK
jgi:hypothetical protein